MKLKVNNSFNKNFSSGKIITPQNPGDAGYDLVAVSHPKVVGDIYIDKLFKNISYIEYETNLSIEPNVDEFGEYEFYSLMFPRSSISNYNLHLCNSVGVIDSGYRDTIKVRFKYIPQAENFYTLKDSTNVVIGVDNSKIYKKGDKIAQLIFQKHLHPKIFMEKKLSKTKNWYWC